MECMHIAIQIWEKAAGGMFGLHHLTKQTRSRSKDSRAPCTSAMARAKSGGGMPMARSTSPCWLSLAK